MSPRGYYSDIVGDNPFLGMDYSPYLTQKDGSNI